MKPIVPVLFLTLLIAACTNDESPTQPRPDQPPSVTVQQVGVVPPRPVSTPVPDSPPTQVLKFNPIPPSGPAPFLLHVNQCLSQSSLPGYPLQFTYDFGDGLQKGGTACRSQHTYQRTGNFRGTFCVTDREPGHNVCTQFTVSVR
jgi:hypothetical protein